MQTEKMLGRASWIVTAIGAINWGLVGLADFDLVEAIFGRDTFASRAFYTVVGVAGLMSAYHLVSKMAQPTVRREMEREFAEMRR